MTQTKLIRSITYSPDSPMTFGELELERELPARNSRHIGMGYNGGYNDKSARYDLE